MTYWNVPHWGTVTIIEVAWLLMGFVAAVTCLYMLRVLLGDVRRVKHGPVTLRIVARSHLRRELVRLVQACAVVALGLYSIVTETSPPVITPTGLFVTGLLFLVAFVSIVQSVWDQHDRQRIISALARRGIEEYLQGGKA